MTKIIDDLMAEPFKINFDTSEDDEYSETPKMTWAGHLRDSEDHPAHE